MPLRKCVDLAPGNRFAGGVTADRFAQSRTPWIKLWADWSVCEPRPGVFDFAALDADLTQARNRGLKAILACWRFPLWANGFDGRWNTPRTSQFEATKYDRMTRAQYDAGNFSSFKAAEYRPPGDLSPRSPWGRWIETLIVRYRGWVDFLEICNEPGLQHWPQHRPSTSGDPWAADPGGEVAHVATASMFQTARTVRNRYGSTPILLGPASDDGLTTSTPPLRTGVDRFTDLLLGELALRRFKPGSKFAWSHHNYTDMERDLSGAANRAAMVRRRLVGRWAGYPAGSSADPQLTLTEGGVRWQKIASSSGVSLEPANYAFFEARQRDLIASTYARLTGGTADGAGIGMLTNYQMSTDPGFDTGLCYADGRPRAAYGWWRDSFPPA